jgi:HEAT repeat protein
VAAFLGLAIGAMPASAAPAAAPATAPAAGATTRPTAEIVRAIGELDSPDWIIQFRAISQLAAWKAPEARAPLTALLAGTGKPWVRGRALVALAMVFGEQMFDVATHHSRSEVPELRAAAVEALGIIGSPRGDAVVAPLAADKDLEVRGQAILALARLRKDKAWPIVSPLLKETDLKLVRCLVPALACVDTVLAQDALVPFLEHPDPLVRLSAVQGVGSFRRPVDIDRLVRRMGDESPFIQEKAQKALAAYPPEMLHRHMIMALESKDRASDHKAAVRLLGLAPSTESCDKVAEMIRREDKLYRPVLGDIAELLGNTDPDRYEDVLRKCLADPAPTVRRDAVRAVARCKKADLFSLLKPLLSDKSEFVAGQALIALAKSTKGAPDGGIVEYLNGPLHANSWDVRRRSVELLSERAKPDELIAGMRNLEAVFSDPEPRNRDYAAKCLTRVGGEDILRQVAAAQGYLTDWMVLGPLPNDKANRGLACVYGPEIELDLKRPSPTGRFDEGAVFEAAAANGKPPGLVLAPPASGGRTVVALALDVPAAAGGPKFAFSIARAELTGRTGPVAFTARVGDKVLITRKLLRPADANSLEVPLTPFAGLRVQLELLAEPQTDARADGLRVGQPRVVVGEKLVADLMLQAPNAFAWTEPKGGEPRRLVWEAQRVANASGVLAFHDILPPPSHYHTAYATTDIHAPADQDVTLEVMSDDGSAVWLDGKEVGRKAETGTQKIPVKLHKGANRLLVKVANLVEWWQCSVRLVDAKGHPVDWLRAAQ